MKMRFDVDNTPAPSMKLPKGTIFTSRWWNNNTPEEKVIADCVAHIMDWQKESGKSIVKIERIESVIRPFGINVAYSAWLKNVRPRTKDEISKMLEKAFA